MLLLGEVLKMGSRLLPEAYNIPSQLLPDVFSSASDFGNEARDWASNTIYQIDSVNRTLQRSGPGAIAPPTNIMGSGLESQDRSRQSEQSKLRIGTQIDESQFRNYLLESQVLNSANYTKWRWDILQAIVEGPLLNPKRLDEAIKATRFMKRIFDFYRPFTYRFSDIKNTKPNQRYVRVGCALIHTLLQTPDGVKFLMDNKLCRQLAECLAQLDPVSDRSVACSWPWNLNEFHRSVCGTKKTNCVGLQMSGLTSTSPMFSSSRLVDTLSCGYFAFIGTMSKDPKGLVILERWRMINMCYRIIELRDRGDLIRVLLGNVDFTL